MHPAFKEFRQVAGVLLEDINAATALHRNAATEFSKRTLIKTSFTYLEGHLYAFKQAVLALEHVLVPMSIPSSRVVNSRVILFTDQERAMLEEFTYDLSSGGHARRKTYYPKLTDSIKFTTNVFHRAIQLPSDIAFNSEGWNHLINTQQIRNRLTHPKTRSCLQVSEEDIRTVGAGVQWYETIIDHMLDRFQTESIYAVRFKENFLPQDDRA